MSNGEPEPARTGRLTRRQVGALGVGLGAVGLGAGGVVAATVAGTVAADAAGTAPSRRTPTPAMPKHQLRGMWIASVENIDWPSKPGLTPAQQRAELVAWYDLAVRRRINAVMVHVRPSGDTFWPSKFEPWSEYLTGRQGADPGYDPMAFAVTEAHRRGLEFHAWFNPYRASMQPDPKKLAPTHPARLHPDWVFRYGPKLLYNPGIPTVRAFVQNVIMEAVEKYDIDGVHFDDYFYPYPIKGQPVPDAETYKKYGKGFDTVQDWRRDNVNTLIKELGARIHKAKPWVKFGVSPFGIWRNKKSDPRGSDTNGLEAYEDLAADTRLWVKNNWLDYITPQLYWTIGLAIADYAKLVPWWANQVAGTRCQLYIGEATYRVGSKDAWLDPAELTRHLNLDRNHPQVLGNIYFSAVSVRADKLGATSMLTQKHYARPALTPPMPHLRGGLKPPAPPTVSARREGNSVVLSLRPGGSGGSGAAGKPRSYAVYRFEGLAREAATKLVTEGADASRLLAVVPSTGRPQTYRDSTATPGRQYIYLVTAVDRLSAESLPAAALPPAR